MVEKTVSENKTERDTVSEAKFVTGVRSVADQKAEDVVVLDVSKLSSFADYFIICHGQSNRQVSALAEHVQEAMAFAGFKPFGVEGQREEAWILIDYGELIIHIFLKSLREFYDLERLWSDASRISIADVLEKE
jgi:ribosome-associated protein